MRVEKGGKVVFLYQDLFLTYIIVSVENLLALNRVNLAVGTDERLS